ncbi:hypothetical protein [Nonomuraea sp. WAC 01424]|uniref:hypothetical protein n=1 Tax=Nonomuraea sp. WAC 01424 TaxID=2203200 RepID=UPI000F76FFE4|nr:hypothetical protein [Nonomuraea sp. WAC 01424]
MDNPAARLPLPDQGLDDPKLEVQGARAPDRRPRVHNAKIGGTYRATFVLNRKQTIEYWAQNWMP